MKFLNISFAVFTLFISVFAAPIDSDESNDYGYDCMDCADHALEVCTTVKQQITSFSLTVDYSSSNSPFGSYEDLDINQVSSQVSSLFEQCNTEILKASSRTDSFGFSEDKVHALRGILVATVDSAKDIAKSLKRIGRGEDAKAFVRAVKPQVKGAKKSYHQAASTSSSISNTSSSTQITSTKNAQSAV
ncbi:hypothetical protein NEOLI_003207 [Neolecta irregularis DAH-3]|uniref:Uncharacterized protein n=1 Tax=Neolecta irregularis (strain DAH-3) TaxID=1198029 RepID=A0A1U7LPS0_NEOID|nr:hypothetical protein NEOLI_003207 [Neolecta irregularis DAH-3]|eukprot:OLL24666.1 hypothetical protein NEOLI_003207 [Neolecta irregularis DAH-3]